MPWKTSAAVRTFGISEIMLNMDPKSDVGRFKHHDKLAFEIPAVDLRAGHLLEGVSHKAEVLRQSLDENAGYFSPHRSERCHCVPLAVQKFAAVDVSGPVAYPW